MFLLRPFYVSLHSSDIFTDFNASIMDFCYSLCLFFQPAEVRLILFCSTLLFYWKKIYILFLFYTYMCSRTYFIKTHLIYLQCVPLWSNTQGQFAHLICYLFSTIFNIILKQTGQLPSLWYIYNEYHHQGSRWFAFCHQFIQCSKTKWPRHNFRLA